MLPTFIGGIIPLAIALVFFGIVLAKVQSIALWIVVVTGIVLMVASLIEAVRSGEEQFGDEATDETKLPEGQQKRGGVS